MVSRLAQVRVPGQLRRDARGEEAAEDVESAGLHRAGVGVVLLALVLRVAPADLFGNAVLVRRVEGHPRRQDFGRACGADGVLDALPRHVDVTG